MAVAPLQLHPTLDKKYSIKVVRFQVCNSNIVKATKLITGGTMPKCEIDKFLIFFM